MSRCRVPKSILACTFSHRIGADILAGADHKLERRTDTQLYSTYDLVVFTIVMPVLFG
jgi:hypothetical protein